MERKQSLKTKTASIDDVYKLACTDKKFLNALLKNTGKALEQAHLKLSEAERISLTKTLTTKITIKGDELLKFLNRFCTKEIRDKVPPPPPPPPWRLIALIWAKRKN